MKKHNNKKYPVDTIDRRFYYVWKSMKKRCFDNNDSSYSRYGGRGIKVCCRWLNFVNFYDDMYGAYLAHLSQHPDQGTQLDRIKNNKNYTPSNCRWVTDYEQRRNKRNNLRIRYDGKTMILKDWSSEIKIPYHTLLDRLRKYGWSTKRAFETAVKK